ncbi:MAG TPA: hypothetical protein VK487_01815 [Candidatus Bathyarchaeia archaeon]|nr:hypothetical protein [Candidatus Bathyarchaeia archaeon]
MDGDCGCRPHQDHREDFCGCSMHAEGHGYRRRFLTKAEKLEKLKSYAEELKKELTAVEEKVKELKS